MRGFIDYDIGVAEWGWEKPVFWGPAFFVWGVEMGVGVRLFAGVAGVLDEVGV